MTVKEALAPIQSLTANGWVKARPVPNNLIAALCEAIWDAGEHPQIKLILAYLPHLFSRTVGPGFHAWRKSRGLQRHYPRWANPNIGGMRVLARLVSAEIAAAPLSFFDKSNDGRWEPLKPRVVAYLGLIQNQSLRDVLALYALIKASLVENPLYHQLASWASPLKKLLEEHQLTSVYEIDPDDLLLRVAEGTAGLTLMAQQRPFIVLGWKTLTNAFLEYGERLNESERAVMSKFFLRPLRKRFRMHRSRPSIVIRDGREERVKAKTDVVHRQFHKLRFMAKIRCNQARRLYDAVHAAIAAVRGGKLPLPHRFSYDETVATETGKPIRQRVLMTLWDDTSLWDEAVVVKMYKRPEKVERKRRRQIDRFSPKRRRFFVQYCGTEPLGAVNTTTPFWFLELYEHHVLTMGGTRQAEVNRRKAFLKARGYTSQLYWEYAAGLLKPFRQHITREATYLEREHSFRFLHYEGIYATSLFAHLTIRMQTITGARLGEVQQIAQNPDCIKQLVNVGPKATTRWVLRLVPKGRRERADYFIDTDTKDVLMEVVRFQRQFLGVKKLPIVNHQSSKYRPDHYVLQWNRLPLDQAALNTALRFLLHGAVLDSNGSCLHITSHLLRHGFATEMASLKVPVDVIAQILHQRHLEVTRCYSRPTKQQVMDAAEMLFVERIDVAAEAVRNPEEIGRMLREAEGQIGALTEVIGGTCVVGNMCPAKFACIGCAGNAPDPERRYQIEAKRAWASEQIAWTKREGLMAEGRQMNQLIQDCDLILEEMTLMERARRDGAQQIVIHPEKRRAARKA